MPIYDYRCLDCGEVTEVITRSISSAVEPVCTKCRSARLEKMPSRIIQHQTEATKFEQLDPRYDRWVDENTELSKKKSKQDIDRIRAGEAKVVADAKAQREKKKIL